MLGSRNLKLLRPQTPMHGDQAHRVLDAARVPIHTLDRNGVITYVNPAAAHVLGWDAPELVGRAHHQTVHHSKADGAPYPADACPIAATLRTGAEQRGADEPFWRRDGTSINVSYTCSPLYENGELAGAVVVFAGQAAQPRPGTELLARIADRLNTQHDLETMLSAVCDEVRRTLRVAVVSLRLYDEKSDMLRRGTGVGMTGELLARMAAVPREQYGSFASTAVPVMVVSDVESARPFPDQDLYRELRLRRVAIAKMQSEEHLVGMLAVGDGPAAGEFTAEELSRLQTLAQQAAQAIGNARLVMQANRRIAYVQALHEMDVAMTSSFDVRFTLNIFLEQLLALLHVDAADVLLHKPSSQLEFATGRGFRTRALEYTRLRIGEGQAGIAARERRMVSIANLRDSVASFSRAPLFQSEGFVAYYALPLIARGQLQGVLEVFNRSPLDPDPEWLNSLETIASRAAMVIDNAVTFDSLQRSNLELMLTCDQMIEALARAADMHEGDSEGQTLGVAEQTLALARLLDVQEKQLVDIKRGALLHDVGTIAVPHHILHKPGPLSEAEWEIVRRHPTFAQQMLSPIAYLRPALEIPYAHHERWDGGGYPLGLKGEQIPLAARIFSVADVWHVLRSPRPFRAAWNDAEARRHLWSQAGSQFDPAVVDAFFSTLR